MSRVINVTADPSDVVAMCQLLTVTISAIEPLPDGGTRVVLMNSDDTATIGRAFKTKIIHGDVRRTPLVTRRR